MIDGIREIVQNILNHWGLTDYVAATVTAESPLQVKIDERLFLEQNNLIILNGLGDLKRGDKLIMLRVLRGQKYILLAKEEGA